MTSAPVLYNAASVVAENLRHAWALGHRVAVTLEGCETRRLEGVVRTVAPTGITAQVAGQRFPIANVLAVHRPSRLGDSTVRGGRWSGPVPAVLSVHAEQMRLPL